MRACVRVCVCVVGCMPFPVWRSLLIVTPDPTPNALLVMCPSSPLTFSPSLPFSFLSCLPTCHSCLPRSNLYVCCDQHADALPCLEISLVARSDSLGVDHADTAASVELLTSVYEALGE